MQTYVTIELRNEQETIDLGKKLAKQLKQQDVIALEGDLGAGKTTLTKSIARELGILEEVDSPTFTIVKEYRGKLPFYHMDVYRLSGPEAEIDLEEYFYGNGICIVEWASRIEEILPPHTVWIELKVEPSGTRRLSIRGNLTRAREIGEGLGVR
ncbi:tRNA (adenosine(37)-N6)-threonylcarbamoyltransferase complex ATPase subunit type 1 TsaE [Hazenella sp. IB182357]|uniref:tRNA threonylcarbamoyladenosine biosynthesis protein TsaE n=1 Tax=Polycladospora coralii TaxID=2771432 RepID=A0A926NBI4_9BACL|nr:tRNA (adenosine(37)-N6)-threonylcarbamoyltransferase complex ATPase subunit type 1 TsaE [Polycladospora coralii]MBD1372290.1 tRNA (adenosine(37)-N6)-threonylcarbamoyltransferase complex ATPase subunit type 1 TsaE [Polycladospora coralii]MBS7531520.1 tRNA (adenosine(37)-N6)-threonylcarbamoyltransferase complex ATPase subunit type 1 TsaE [Polycladospora coralii]